MQRLIRIENARAHNLRGVDCEIPLGRLTVVTGPSGSGKTSLAFDTLYAEGQRRYVSSLSAYARQFLERLPRPAVDRISNLPPAIAIEQRGGATNARATVGSATEVLDHLRLLYAQIGTTICPACDEEVDAGGIVATAERIAREWHEQRIQIVAPLRAGRGRASEVVAELVKEGFARLLGDDGGILDLLERAPRRKASSEAPWWLLIDRIDLRGGAEVRGRLIEAVSQAFGKGRGELAVRGASGRADSARTYREGRVCNGCGTRFPEPSPGLFSFNNALGACPRCEGFGRIAEIDWDRVVPDPRKSLAEDAIALFATRSTRGWRKWLFGELREAGIDLEAPFASLPEAERRFVLEGEREGAGGAVAKGGFEGVRSFFEWLEGRRYKVQARVQLARHRRYSSCPECAGARLSEGARAVRIEGRSLADLGPLPLEALQAWVEDLSRRGVGGAGTRRILDLLVSRLQTIHAVGLGYVSLDRAVRTLSGGEAQRIQLATALGGSLTASLYVLDEPSVGLHAADQERLLRVLEAIRDQGNTVVVVEHALPLIEAADHVIDLGPGAGRRGGTIVAAGPLAAILASPESKTGAILRARARPPARARRELARAPRLRLQSGRIHNLDALQVDLPLGGLVALTGVSGAGKSTLVREVLVPGIEGRASAASGAGARVGGAEQIEGVVLVDQVPGVRSARSNPASVTKAFDPIRQRFAETREARARGYTPGFFSFNVAGGRCEECEGTGEVEIDMQFLDDLRVACDACGGKRYRKEVLDVRIDGRSILDVLELSIEDACALFSGEGAKHGSKDASRDAKIVERLRPLIRVGLGYLALGQPLSTLSGGEHQRLRLALALLEGAGRTLYVFDEPTTGLHASDVDVLLDCFDEVIGAGASVLVVEHDLDVIARADWVIDLGPGGGPHGGRLVAEGPPEQIVRCEASLTGRLLAPLLRLD